MGLFKMGKGPEGRVVEAMQDMMMTASQLPTNSANDQSFYTFLEMFMVKVQNLPPGGIMIAPAGWSTDTTTGHIMLFVLSRDANDVGA